MSLLCMRKDRLSFYRWKQISLLLFDYFERFRLLFQLLNTRIRFLQTIQILLGILPGYSWKMYVL